MKGVIHRAGLLGLLLLLCQTYRAAAIVRCEICGQTTATNWFTFRDQVRLTMKTVCEPCSKLEKMCEQCRLPLLGNKFRDLGDSRRLCVEDAKLAVLDEAVAAAALDEAKEEVRRILAQWPPLPDHGITTHLVNRRDFIKEFRKLPREEAVENLRGLTVSRHDLETNWEHHIYLLNGLPKAELLAVCAHELTHVWLNEHEQRVRTLHKDAIEGFCEQIAYKYVQAIGLTNETKRIQENNYTRGQVESLLKAEEQYQFYRIIDWVQNGVDSWLDPEQPVRLLALRDQSSASPAPELKVSFAPFIPPPAPDKLMLKGVARDGNQRFALVNDQTLIEGESAKVRVGTSNVVVRCISIGKDSVVLQVVGSNEPVQLQLGGKP